MRTSFIILFSIIPFLVLSCSSSRVINYRENAFSQQSDFNTQSFDLKGTIYKTDSTSVLAENMRISDSTLYCALLPSKQTFEIPLSQIRFVEFTKKAGPVQVGAFSLLGLTVGTFFALQNPGASGAEFLALPVIGGAIGTGVGLSNSSSTKFLFQDQMKIDSIPNLPPDQNHSPASSKNDNKMPHQIIDYTDQTSKNIEDFNFLAYKRSGILLRLDSAALVGHDFHISDSVMTWTDLSSHKKMSVLFSSVQSVDIIKKPDTRDAVRGGTIGLVVAGIAACFIGVKMITSAQQKSQNEEDNEGMVIGAAVMAGTIVGVLAMAGLATGASAADHDTRITVIFHEPIGPKSKLRQKISTVAIQTDIVFVLKKDTADIPDTSAGVRKANTGQAVKQVEITKQTQKQPTLILKKDQIKTPRKTTFGALSWTVANMGLPLYLASNDLPSKELKNLPRGYAVLIAPSIGNFYARDTRRTLIGLGIRLGGAGVMGLGWRLTPNNQDPNPLFYVGMFTIGAGVIYSLYTTPSSVREYNARQSWSLAPIVDPNRKSASLAFRFQF